MHASIYESTHSFIHVHLPCCLPACTSAYSSDTFDAKSADSTILTGKQPGIRTFGPKAAAHRAGAARSRAADGRTSLNHRCCRVRSM